MLIMKAAPRPLNEREMSAWRTFYEMQEVLRSRLEQQLQADSGLSNADYTVLVALSEAAGGRLRVFELGRRLGWEKSRLHHQLTRMCRRGLDPTAQRRRAGHPRRRHRRRPRRAQGSRPPPHPTGPTPGPRPAHPAADRPARRHFPHDPRRSQPTLTLGAGARRRSVRKRLQPALEHPPISHERKCLSVTRQDNQLCTGLPACIGEDALRGTVPAPTSPNSSR